MDAVEFLKTKSRMCHAYVKDSCCGCPLRRAENYCALWCFVNPEGAVDAAERWAKQHPVKTRQSEFLKQWPEALMTEDGLVNICPCRFVAGFRDEKGECTQYHSKGCDNCRREFWTKEVE